MLFPPRRYSPHHDPLRPFLRHPNTYSNTPDFINPDPIGTIFPSSLPEYIKQYKETQDPKLSFRIMVILSKLILKMLHQEVKKYSKILQYVEMQELYNMSFICLHRAILKFEIEKSSIYSFPRYLQGYIKAEIKKIHREGSRLICCGESAMNFDHDKVSSAERQTERGKRLTMLRIKVEDFLKRQLEESKLKEEAIEVFKLHVLKGYSYREIAEQVGNGRTANAVRWQIRGVIAIIRRELRLLLKSKENKLF